MHSTVVNKMFHHCSLSRRGVCCTSARSVTGVQRPEIISSPRSLLVSQGERQILFQIIWMQVSGENLLTIHIPKWFCSLTYGHSLMTVIATKAEMLSLMQQVWGRIDAQVVTMHVLAVTGMVGPWNPVNWGAGDRMLRCVLCDPWALQPFPLDQKWVVQFRTQIMWNKGVSFQTELPIVAPSVFNNPSWDTLEYTWRSGRAKRRTFGKDQTLDWWSFSSLSSFLSHYMHGIEYAPHPPIVLISSESEVSNFLWYVSLFCD